MCFFYSKEKQQRELRGANGEALLFTVMKVSVASLVTQLYVPAANEDPTPTRHELHERIATWVDNAH